MGRTAFKMNNWRRYAQQAFDTPALDWDDGLVQRATYDTQTASHVNSVFGATLFAQYNDENNFYAALPQVDRSQFQGLEPGDVVPKAYRAVHSPVQLDSHGTGGASISTARTDSVEEFSVEVKVSETVLEVSDLQQIESLIEDAPGLEEFMELREEQLDLAIDRDALADPVLAGDNDYSNRNEITELDRAIASSDEQSNADDTNNSAYGAGDLDYGTASRDSASNWADAYVDHNSGIDRQLTRDLMDTFLQNLGDSGDSDPYQDGVILTGRDSARVLSDLMADSARGTRISFESDGQEEAINDAFTNVGIGGTTRFRHYDGIPIVPNQNAPADGLSRIFVVPMDTIRGEPKVSIEQYAEPYFEDAGRYANSGQGYIAQGNYKETALFLLYHELMVRDFTSCGKLRDLSE